MVFCNLLLDGLATHVSTTRLQRRQSQEALAMDRITLRRLARAVGGESLRIGHQGLARGR